MRVWSDLLLVDWGLYLCRVAGIVSLLLSSSSSAMAENAAVDLRFDVVLSRIRDGGKGRDNIVLVRTMITMDQIINSRMNDSFAKYVWLRINCQS